MKVKARLPCEEGEEGVPMQFRHWGPGSAFRTQPVTCACLSTGPGPSVYAHIRLLLPESGHTHTQKKTNLKCFNS